MNIQIFSDIHQECYPDNSALWDFIKPQADIAIVAGDIDSISLEKTLNDIATKFKKVLFVNGNHDTYYRDISWKPNKDLLASNVIDLNESVYELDDVVFIGATLWSDFKNNDWFVMQNAKQGISDFKLIKNGNDRFSPEDARLLHLRQKQFIIDSIEQYKETGKKIVVVTHFLPCFDLIDKRYKTTDDPLNYYFSANCNVIIEKYNDDITLFVNGHTHLPYDTYLGNIRCVCNPLGYPFENKIFNNKIIAL